MCNMDEQGWSTDFLQGIGVAGKEHWAESQFGPPCSRASLPTLGAQFGPSVKWGSATTTSSLGSEVMRTEWNLPMNVAVNCPELQQGGLTWRRTLAGLPG